jgi:predicted ATPase/DNA-binding CsgD family transcriptional regulator
MHRVTHRGELEREVHHTPLPGGLLRPPTSFVGRERELGLISQLLDETLGPSGPPLITLTGAPGAGKTRLAIEAAIQLAAGATFDRIEFVDLSPLAPGEAQQMLTLVGEALGLLPLATDELAGRITEYLDGSRVLLVIDNFEHVLEAATDLAELLERSPGTRTLVTSQRPLGIYGERELPVSPLATPPPGSRGAANVGAYPTVQLFVERARARAPEFELTDGNAATVADICRRLDGLPLALELAAPRIRLLPPEALLARLADRLGLLTGGPRDQVARHRTLHMALDWSYQLLEPQQQLVLRQLAVFAGGFSLSAANVVVGTRPASTLDSVQALLDNGLLRVESAAGEPRYRMLETVREYAADRLVESGEYETIRERYTNYYLHPGTLGLGRRTRLAPADDDNLRDALEGVLADSLAVSRLQDDQHQIAIALDGLGGLAVACGDFDAARMRHQESARLFTALGDISGAAIATLHLGQVAALAGESTEARGLIEDAVGRLKVLGERGAAATGLVELSQLALDEGDLAAASATLAEGLRLATAAVDTLAVVSGLDRAVGLAAAQGRTHAAARLAGAVASMRAHAASVRPDFRTNAAGPAIEAVRAALGHEQFEVDWAEGHDLRVDEAIAYALAVEAPDERPASERMHPPPPLDAASGLSPREREVAVLIARGHTNREIADRLVITEWTVDTHVRHILSKLGLRSRAQVAAWAVERGLLTH